MNPTVTATFTTSGALASLLADDLSLLQYPANEVEAGPHQVWLRLRTTGGIEAFPLTGPGSGAHVAPTDGGVRLSGEAGPLAWSLTWVQPGPGLFGWRLLVRNRSDRPASFDAVWTFDAALTEPETLRRNEFYVSQYLDVSPLGGPERFVLAVRQNMPGSGNPWLGLTSSALIAGWCTDALQVRAEPAGTGLDLSRDLPSARLQHEHTLTGLQTGERALVPGDSTELQFRGLVEAAHPAASQEDDAERVHRLIEAADWAAPAVVADARATSPTPFAPAHWLHGEDLPEDELFALLEGSEGVERGPDGELWSFWVGGAHLVTAAKERMVLRPHGHILRASAGLHPQDITSAATVWMAGTFVSQLTRGHACAEPTVSVRRSYLGLTLAEGARLLLRDGGQWRLLGSPSAWAVTAHGATWWYRWGARTLRVTTELSLARLELSVDVEGDPLDLRLAVRGPDDEVWTREEQGVTSLAHTFELGPEAPAADEVAIPQLTSADASAQRLARLLPSLAGNALIHYLAPRGLEQFTGGAWGTRDVCQGPVGLLMAADRPDLVREVLLTVFAGQQDDGDWPQWFDYLDASAAPGHRESHGDVVYWPLLALGEYLTVTGDHTILDEPVRWVGDREFRPPSTVAAHVRAAVEHLLRQRSADPRLPSYGHGDWNDALQPAHESLARQLVSTWTAELEIKALSTLADGLRPADEELAARLAEVSAHTEEALRERLLIDGELCGYALITDDALEPLVHPRDTQAHLSHGSLQMIHALADELLTPDEARAHLRVIDESLDGPTGIYLFDRPVEYRGGETHTFLRAEAASFWGREIGLMYTHAHVRWVEALLRLGLPERAWAALQRVLPEGLRAAVPGVVPLQSNCYHSSVDALFRDRYEAQAHGERLFDEQMGFAGGWRVYSSGPGLVLRLVVEQLLGLRWTQRGLEIDPVLPPELDGLKARLRLGGRDVAAEFSVGAPGHGVAEVRVDGRVVRGQPLPRRYRAGGVLLDGWLGADPVQLHIRVGR